MIAVEFQGVSKRFGEVEAVAGVDLAIANGEFFTLLGPSGSGKTTCLRLVAGFDLPSAGRILLDGADVSNLPPYERNVNTVFQDYALFPHLSVGENVAYGPMVRGVGSTERRRLADEMLALVELSGLSDRRPAQLSGGQRQRVALARALVNRPKVLLLDEPLGALDLKLRHQMQIELKAIQQHVGITFIFVTHDQEEALTMSDRLAVFEGGRIAQIGTPAEVYESPATEFIAGFVGTANVLRGAAARRILGHEGLFALRPEKISLLAGRESAAPGARQVEGTLTEIVFAGMVTRYTVAIEGGFSLHVAAQNLAPAGRAAFARGARVVLAWDPIHERPLAES
ncbi:MAG: ABC transporter ATP-binding protein [Thermoanaerobaculia bacterium]|nr:ABC transporter ATP-binding protein [Thermoanaerobaculia bacterium]MBP9824600.1 ABC transporter ATP-binding protein [Thermoanaerobaculia bacterium]